MGLTNRAQALRSAPAHNKEPHQGGKVLPSGCGQPLNPSLEPCNVTCMSFSCFDLLRLYRALLPRLCHLCCAISGANPLPTTTSVVPLQLLLWLASCLTVALQLLECLASCAKCSGMSAAPVLLKPVLAPLHATKEHFSCEAVVVAAHSQQRGREKRSRVAGHEAT